MIDVELRDVPIIGGILSAGLVVGEVAIHAVDLLAIVASGLLINIDSLFQIVWAVDRLAQVRDAIPQELTQQLVTAVLVVIIAYRSIKFIRRLRNDEN